MRAKTWGAAGAGHQLGAVQAVEIGAGGHRRARTDAHLGGDARRSGGVVPGDHLHADARVLAATHRRDGLVAGRIDDPDHADQDQAARYVVEVQHSPVVAGRPQGDGQGPLGVRRNPLDLSVPVVRVEGMDVRPRSAGRCSGGRPPLARP